MSLEIVLQKEVPEGDWKFLLNKLSYSFQSPIILTDDFNKWRNCFSKWRLSSKSSTDMRLYTLESSKIELFEGEKLFIHNIFWIFGSVLIVCVHFESCQSVKKASRNLFQISWIFHTQVWNFTKKKISYLTSVSVTIVIFTSTSVTNS